MKGNPLPLLSYNNIGKNRNYSIMDSNIKRRNCMKRGIRAAAILVISAALLIMLGACGKSETARITGRLLSRKQSIKIRPIGRFLVSPRGFETQAHGLGNRCSIP